MRHPAKAQNAAAKAKRTNKKSGLKTRFFYFTLRYLKYFENSGKIILLRLNLVGGLMLKELINNEILWVSLLAWAVAQILKLLISSIVNRKFDFKRLVGDGGMPSVHTAFVSALAAMCGGVCGFDSVYFAISLVFLLVVMRDAIGVRRETGKQAKSIKELAETINQIFLEKDEEIRTEKLKEFVGHTPLQVFFGLITGVSVALIYLLIK